MTEIVMHDGAGSFAFADDTGGVRRTLRVFYFQPTGGTRDRRIVVAMHGLDRKAAEFRDVMQRPAERNGQILLVPEFDLQQFPDNFAYNFGGVRLPSSMTVLPREAWNFGLLDQLFQRVVAVTGSTAKSFGLFGNSAGAQYVLRYLALTEAPAVDRVVASNSGMYMLPDLAADYPTGMGGLDLDQRHLRRYLGRRLVLLLGEADTTRDEGLPRGEIADAQGPHRLARGNWYYDHCRKLAERLGVPFGWQRETVPGAGHASQEIFDRGSSLLS